MPSQPLEVLWGANDRILQGKPKAEAAVLLGERITELSDCGHLPHIDQPGTVVRTWHG